MPSTDVILEEIKHLLQHIDANTERTADMLSETKNQTDKIQRAVAEYLGITQEN